MAPYLDISRLPETLKKTSADAGFALSGCDLCSFRSFDLAGMDAFLEEQKISGIIMHGSSFISNEDVLDNVRDLSIPVVLVFASLNDLLRQHLPGSYCDLPEGWELGLRYLKKIGHRRIGVVAPFIRGCGFREYQSLLSHIGLDNSAELLPKTALFTQLENKNRPQEYAEQINQEVLRMLGLAKPPSVFYCFNDYWALPVYATLNKLGLRIPGDVAVLGFTSSLDCESLAPPLTSIGMDIQQVYTHAVSLIEQQKNIPTIMKIELPLHKRSST